MLGFATCGTKFFNESNDVCFRADSSSSQQNRLYCMGPHRLRIFRARHFKDVLESQSPLGPILNYI